MTFRYDEPLRDTRKRRQKFAYAPKTQEEAVRAMEEGSGLDLEYGLEHEKALGVKGSPVRDQFVARPSAEFRSFLATVGSRTSS